MVAVVVGYISHTTTTISYMLQFIRNNEILMAKINSDI